MELKKIEIEMVFSTAKIQRRLTLKYRVIVWDVREVNRTLEGLRFFVTINPDVVLGIINSPVRPRGEINFIK